MKMDVINSLARILTAVVNNAETVGEVVFCGNFGNGFKNLCDVAAVFGVYHISAGDMLLGDNNNVKGGLGIDILKSQNTFILINL